MPHSVKRAVRRRTAFTLIEMLVVLAIIAVLLSLTAAAVFRTIGRQQANNTKALLTKVEGEFTKDYAAAADKYATEPIPNQGSLMGNAYYNTVLPMAGGERGRAQVIWTKLRLKQTFPMTFAEALNPAPMPALSTYNLALGQLGYTTANTTTPQAWESSVLLLMALQRGMDGNGIKMEDLGVNSSLHDFGPTPNGQTVKGLVDGWGKPLVFVRWPVYLNATNAQNPGNYGSYGLTGAPQAKFNDPGDPTGLLASPSWQGTAPSYSAAFQWFTTNVHGLAPHAANTEPTTYRIVPIIASAGQNNALGFNPLGVTLPSPAPATAPTAGVNIDADDLLATLNK